MSVDILIPNFQGREALELCLESIARHTPEPHRVIVYDDGSTAPEDAEYLRRAFGVGTARKVIKGGVHRGHGHALNVLTAHATSEYAAVIDNDVQILRTGWLFELLALAADPRVLAVCDWKDNVGYCSRGYRPGMFLFWFGLLNMSAYRDGMQTNWAREDARRSDEPWRSLFAPYYPPEDNVEWRRLRETQSWYSDFDRDAVIFDPGAALWAKMRYENPKGYQARPLTAALRASFRHWGHAQSWLDPANVNAPQARAMRAQINAELKRLREGR
jgi:glycosyltransferase involved in cell wall biosynthesis